MLRVCVIAIAFSCACRDPQLEKVRAVRDEVCACRDIKCGEEALKKMPSLEGTPGHRAKTLANEMTTCMSKLYLKEPEKEPQEPGPDISEDLTRPDGGIRINLDAKDR